MNLQTIARALGGVVRGNEVMAPGPGLSLQDRSLIVWIDPNSPDLFMVQSRCGADAKACRDFVKAKLAAVQHG